MPLDHSTATATVSITGLALGCYNLDTNNYEVGFIRHPDHILTIKVETKTPDGTTASTTFLLDRTSKHRIFIETVGGITPEPRFFKPTVNFDRQKSEQDAEDFQWIVDIEKELNNGQEVTLKAPAFPVTEMYISKPILYADSEGFVIGKLNLVNADNLTEVQPFGELCEVIKGDITCEEGGAVILRVEGPHGFSLCLPRITGITHTIIMDNTCPPPPPRADGRILEGKSDFTVYYSVVRDTGGKRFDFKRVDPDVENPDSTCNGTTMSVRRRLFPIS